MATNCSVVARRSDRQEDISKAFQFACSYVSSLFRNRPICTKYYEILGVDPEANEAQLKTAYKKTAFLFHTDRAGANEHIKDINEAFRVLSTPALREAYDKGGIIGVQRYENGLLAEGRIIDIGKIIREKESSLAEKGTWQDPISCAMYRCGLDTEYAELAAIDLRSCEPLDPELVRNLTQQGLGFITSAIQLALKEKFQCFVCQNYMAVLDELCCCNTDESSKQEGPHCLNKCCPQRILPCSNSRVKCDQSIVHKTCQAFGVDPQVSYKKWNAVNNKLLFILK
ncbi:dnaJ domain-containing protein [Ditylenchus destructor]|uniref:DnaJ domain-containing protein n=1 Tax=Ditylenchus destructor TaxID=166010 RepID=A0AAD4MUG3_9BILA|nr:dnaJ domain-containing protein [Ditylenchus destructor]